MAYAAQLLDRKSAKVMLVFANVVLTALLAPWAVAGLSFGLGAVFAGAWEPLPMALLGAGGLLGLAGAWLRAFFNSARLNAQPFMRCLIGTTLAWGLITAAVLVLGVFARVQGRGLWLYVLALFVGTWCLVATIWPDDRVA